MPQVKEKIEAKAAFDDVGIKYFDTVTHDRKAYRDAIGAGKGVTELDISKNRAAEEITELFEEINAWI